MHIIPQPSGGKGTGLGQGLSSCRAAIGHMKEGEEAKTKTYSALIWTSRAIQKKDIGFLDSLKVQCAALCLLFSSSA